MRKDCFCYKLGAYQLEMTEEEKKNCLYQLQVDWGNSETEGHGKKNVSLGYIKSCLS